MSCLLSVAHPAAATTRLGPGVHPAHIPGGCPSPYPTRVQAPFSPSLPPLIPFPPASWPHCEGLGIQASSPAPAPHSLRCRWRGNLGRRGPLPWEGSLPSLHQEWEAEWRPGLGTTGSPSQILFPEQLQSYRVPGFEGSGSGVWSQATPALGREVTPRSVLPAYDHFTGHVLVIPAKQRLQNGKIYFVGGF